MGEPAPGRSAPAAEPDARKADDRLDELERAGWARQSATYDEGFGALAAGVHGAMLDAAAGHCLLDVGCGTGRLAAAAAERGARVTVTDVVHDMVVRTAAAVPGVKVLRAALPHLPFADGAFGAAVGAFVVNHVADPPAALREFRRVVRPGGRVVLSSWDADGHNRALGVFSEAIADADADADDSELFEASPLRATPDAFAALLRDAGLRDVRVDRVAWTHHVPSDQWWRDVLGGTVRTASRIDAQDDATTARIRAAYDRAVAVHRTSGGHLALPAAALLASGTR